MNCKQNNNRGGWIKYPLLLFSMGMMAFGFIRQEHLTVLKKAITICLECIGVGLLKKQKKDVI